MGNRFVLAFILAGCLSLVAAAAQAEGAFSTLRATSAVELSQEEMADVRGANHVIRLITLRSGTALPVAAAVDSTTNAGSIGGVGQDRPKIVGLLL